MKQKTDIPLPEKNLKSFKKGDEVHHLGMSFSTDDCNFEIIDPEQGAVRSLMTGDDLILDEGYFIRLEEVSSLPSTSNLSEAQRGDNYRNILDGSQFRVLSTDEHTVKLIDNDSGQIRLHSKIGSEIFYKLEKEADGPMVDEYGQYLLFDF